MSLIDALAQQAQASALQQAPGTGVADAISKGMQLNIEQQKVNEDHLFKTKQLQQQLMQQFMEREQKMLEMAGDINKPPGARKNYLDYASRFFSQWSGSQGYSEDFKKLMTSDNDFAKKYGGFMSQMLAAAANPEEQAKIMDSLAKAATANGEDAVFISKQMEDALAKRFSLIGNVNQGRGQQETADRQMFNSLQSQLEGAIKDLSSSTDDKGNVTVVPKAAYDLLNTPYDAANPKASIDAKTRGLQMAQKLIQTQSAKGAKTKYGIEETHRSQDKLSSAQNDFQNAMLDSEKEYYKTSSGAKRVLELIKNRDAAAVEMSVALIQRSMGDVGNMAVQEQQRYIQSGLKNDFTSMLAYLSSNPDLKSMSPQQYKTLERAVRSAYEIQGDVFKNKIVGEISRRANSLNEYERRAFQKGGPGWRQAQKMLNRVSAETGKKYSLMDEVKVGDTAKPVPPKEVQFTPEQKAVLKKHQDAIRNNKSLSPAEKRQKMKLLIDTARQQLQNSGG